MDDADAEGSERLASCTTLLVIVRLNEVAQEEPPRLGKSDFLESHVTGAIGKAKIHNRNQDKETAITTSRSLCLHVYTFPIYRLQDE